jgi:hypothetical protein
MFSMPSLILVVFVIQLAIHLISTFGGQAINDLVYSYSHPNETNDSHADHSFSYGSSTPNFPRRSLNRPPPA